MKSRRVMAIPEEEVVFDHPYPRRPLFEPRVEGEQLVGEDQEGFIRVHLLGEVEAGRALPHRQPPGPIRSLAHDLKDARTVRDSCEVARDAFARQSAAT